MLLFVKHEAHRCDFLQLLVHFYSQILWIESFNFHFSSQYVLFGLTSYNTSNIMYYTVIIIIIIIIKSERHHNAIV